MRDHYVLGWISFTALFIKHFFENTRLQSASQKCKWMNKQFKQVKIKIDQTNKESDNTEYSEVS